MRKPIANIRIAAGNPGWYDSLTNIHLTIARPTAFVYEGQNVTNIKKGIRYRLVSLIEGDLEPISSEIKETPKDEEVRDVIETPVVKEEQQQEQQETVKEEVVKQEENIKTEEPKQEEQPKQEEVKEQEVKVEQQQQEQQAVKEEQEEVKVAKEQEEEKKTTRKKAAK